MGISFYDKGSVEMSSGSKGLSDGSRGNEWGRYLGDLGIWYLFATWLAWHCAALVVSSFSCIYIIIEPPLPCLHMMWLYSNKLNSKIFYALIGFHCSRARASLHTTNSCKV